MTPAAPNQRLAFLLRMEGDRVALFEPGQASHTIPPFKRVRSDLQVDSISKCTAEGFVDDLIGCSVAEALARQIIECVNDEGKFMIGYVREVGAFREVAAQQPIGVLVSPALPGGRGGAQFRED